MANLRTPSKTKAGFGSISLVVSILLKLIPWGKDSSTQQVRPMAGTEVNFTEDSYNKAIELKVEDKGELFSLKREEISFN